MNKNALLLLFCLSVAVTGYSQEAPLPTYSLGPVTPYSVAVQSSNDVLRSRRGERYNRPNASIPELGENSEPTLLDLPASHHFERDAMPFQRSDAVVVAKVQSGQAFLSNDKRNIYSEYRAIINEVLKSASYLASGDAIDIEREGGVVKLPSGKILVRGKVTDSQPIPGGHYLLFLKYNPDTEDFHIQTAYQLHGGKVYWLDDQRTSEIHDNIHHALQLHADNSDEFLTQVRNKAKRGNQ